MAAKSAPIRMRREALARGKIKAPRSARYRFLNELEAAHARKSILLGTLNGFKANAGFKDPIVKIVKLNQLSFEIRE